MNSAAACVNLTTGVSNATFRISIYKHNRI